MKKLFFSLSILSLLAFSVPVLAQQQINNDGATGSDLQQQTGSDNIQQNGGAQQASDITNNAGAAVIQNAPNQPLEVTGAPANTTRSTETSGLRWVIIFAIFFAILLSPAVLYARRLPVASETAASSKSPKTDKAVQAADAKPADSKSTSATAKKKSTPKPKAKKSTKKAKRNKKKK